MSDAARAGIAPVVRHDPLELWLVRHGQSLGNVARDAAHEEDREALDIAQRDMDVPLSELGCQQAQALGRWIAQQGDRPTAVIASPYVRAMQTAELVLEAAGLDCRLFLDERLREREFGILDLLTRRGIEARFPEEAQRRRRLGKFYHRPPGGESWVDVALRMRSLRDSIAREHLDERVMLVTHEVVIVMWRYLLDSLDEHQALQLSREHPIANCSLTRYRTGPDDLLHLDLDALRRWPMPVDDDGDKYARGTLLVIAGSASTPGAAILSGMAALRMGAGRLQIATDVSTVAHTAVAVPEALVLPLADASDEPSGELLGRIEGAQCVLVGPGLLDADMTRRVVAAVIDAAAPDSVVVLDASALDAAGSLGRDSLGRLRGRLVLTPNRQELSQLREALGASDTDEADDADESDAVAFVARSFGAVVTCFHDVAAHDGRRWQSQAGHPGLGTSGSGDVLAGLIAGAAARTGDAAQAACWGTLTHQLAGERLGQQCGQLGFLARDLIDSVVPAMSGLV